VKVDWYCAEKREVFECLGCFGMGVDVLPIEISPSATLKKLSCAGMRRHKRGCKKSKS